jgi:hypothetical protein
VTDTDATAVREEAAKGPSSLSVGAKLVVFSTALTIVAVSIAFLVLSLSLKRHTKAKLAESLAKHQQTLSNLQRENLDELLRISTLMTDSPTLRAAMETFASESSPSSAVREDLLATIQNEADKVALGLGRDLLLVTDRRGRVLAAAGPSAPAHQVGEDLSAFPVIGDVLRDERRPGAENGSVVAFDGDYVRVGCAPIVLSGFIIGTLTLGDRIDSGFAGRDLSGWRRGLDSGRRRVVAEKPDRANCGSGSDVHLDYR